jgi:ubiquinone/menaquinone biosynthesis C-methylase UbiE
MLKFIITQFSHPRGFFGEVVGWLMAQNNQKRIAWAVSLLKIQNNDRILEIGFGPGNAIQQMAVLAPKGHIAGIDISDVMLRQASRRNAEAIQAGHVELHQTSVESMPFPDAAFDKAFSSNNFQFWSDQAKNLREVRRVLKPDGILAIVLQPRWAKTDDEVRLISRETANKLTIAGFLQVRVEYKAMKPMMAFCVLANK